MFVVTLPASAAKDPRSFALRAKKAGADILEIRSDLTPRVASFTSPLPLLLALRTASKSLLSRFDPKYIDIEMTSLRSFDRPSATKQILSFHDYKKTPSLSSLIKLANRMRKENPWAIKIATTVLDEKDLQTLLALQDSLKKQKVRSIILGMGPLAHLTRVLSPHRNAITYAALDPETASADGQLPLSFYHYVPRVKKPSLFGIIGGSQITASLSPLIQNALFQRHKIDALYSCFPSSNLRKTISILSTIGVKGYSVTTPFKRDAYALAKKREKLVQSLGVANTLKRTGKNFAAWLTDAYGIQHGYPVLQKASSVAILGAGGAVPSVIYAVRKSNPKAVMTVFARDPKKASAVLTHSSVKILPLAKAEGFVTDVVICAISEDVSFPMPSAKTAIDLRYGKITAFLHEAKKRRMKTFDGTPMLIHQALKQFRHFTGKAPFADDAEYCMSILTTH